MLEKESLLKKLEKIVNLFSPNWKVKNPDGMDCMLQLLEVLPERPEQPPASSTPLPPLNSDDIPIDLGTDTSVAFFAIPETPEEREEQRVLEEVRRRLLHIVDTENEATKLICDLAFETELVLSALYPRNLKVLKKEDGTAVTEETWSDSIDGENFTRKDDVIVFTRTFNVKRKSVIQWFESDLAYVKNDDEEEVRKRNLSGTILSEREVASLRQQGINFKTDPILLEIPRTIIGMSIGFQLGAFLVMICWLIAFQSNPLLLYAAVITGCLGTISSGQTLLGEDGEPTPLGAALGFFAGFDVVMIFGGIFHGLIFAAITAGVTFSLPALTLIHWMPVVMIMTMPVIGAIVGEGSMAAGFLALGTHRCLAISTAIGGAIDNVIRNVCSNLVSLIFPSMGVEPQLALENSLPDPSVVERWQRRNSHITITASLSAQPGDEEEKKQEYKELSPNPRPRAVGENIHSSFATRRNFGGSSPASEIPSSSPGSRPRSLSA